MIKKILLLVSCLILCGCTNDKVKGYDGGVEYYNVQYQFNYVDMDYDVYVDKNQYKVKPSNLYTVYVLEYDHYKKEDKDGNVVSSCRVENKFYTKTLELFVFVIK